MGKIPIGTIIDLTGSSGKVSRRKFLRNLSIFGAGVAGLASSIEAVYGAKLEGYPLVRSVDSYGNPATVRIVEEKRHNALKIYSDPDLRSHFQKYPELNQIRLDESERGEFTFQFVVGNLNKTVESQLPNRLEEFEVEYVEGEGERTLDECSPRHDRSSPMDGGLAISPSNDSIYGTLGIVAYDSSGDEVLISANHLIKNNGSTANYMTQGGRRVASYSANSGRMDCCKYVVDSGISTYSRHVIDVGSVFSAWTYSGLYDAIRNDPPYEVPCEFSGARNCFNSNAVQDVVRDRKVDYEAEMSSRENAGGDSGGAWVDTSNDRLVCIHQGSYSPNWSPYSYDVGGVAAEALSSVGATLSP